MFCALAPADIRAAQRSAVAIRSAHHRAHVETAIFAAPYRGGGYDAQSAILELHFVRIQIQEEDCLMARDRALLSEVVRAEIAMYTSKTTAPRQPCIPPQGRP